MQEGRGRGQEGVGEGVQEGFLPLPLDLPSGGLPGLPDPFPCVVYIERYIPQAPGPPGSMAQIYIPARGPLQKTAILRGTHSLWNYTPVFTWRRLLPGLFFLFSKNQ